MARLEILLALVAMISYGIWTALLDMASETVHPLEATLITYTTATLVTAGYIFLNGPELSLGGAGMKYAALSGVFTALAAVAFVSALSRGRSATISTIVGLFFVVSVCIGVVFFSENLSPLEALGIGFAVLAVVLIGS